jgi:hypothetical protein
MSISERATNVSDESLARQPVRIRKKAVLLRAVPWQGEIQERRRHIGRGENQGSAAPVPDTIYTSKQRAKIVESLRRSWIRAAFELHVPLTVVFCLRLSVTD